MDQISIIIPTLNEAKTIKKLALTILDLLVDYHVNIIFVDDGSVDGTEETLLELSEQYESIHIIERKQKFGFGSALYCGFKNAIECYDPSIIVTMDADLSHDPIYLPSMLNFCTETSIVIGSRYIEGGGIYGWSLSRTLISKIANSLVKLFLGVSIRDCTSGYRCYNSTFIKENLSNIESTGYSIQIELIINAVLGGYDVIEKPIIFYDRTYGKSKLNISQFYLFLKRIFKLRKSTRTMRGSS